MPEGPERIKGWQHKTIPDRFMLSPPYFRNDWEPVEYVRADLVAEVTKGERISHGRHCTCTPCAQEDWTNPDLAPCGMHGPSCSQQYQPLGGAGEVLPITDPERGSGDRGTSPPSLSAEQADAANAGHKPIKPGWGQ